MMRIRLIHENGPLCVPTGTSDRQGEAIKPIVIRPPSVFHSPHLSRRSILSSDGHTPFGVTDAPGRDRPAVTRFSTTLVLIYFCESAWMKSYRVGERGCG